MTYEGIAVVTLQRYPTYAPRAAKPSVERFVNAICDPAGDVYIGAFPMRRDG